MADWTLYAANLKTGEARFFPCKTDACWTGVIGLCLHCDTIWMRCGCGANNFDCECGRCEEVEDQYLQRRVVALEIAIEDHRQAKADGADDTDRALYAVFDEAPVRE